MKYLMAYWEGFSCQKEGNFLKCKELALLLVVYVEEQILVREQEIRTELLLEALKYIEYFAQCKSFLKNVNPMKD